MEMGVLGALERFKQNGVGAPFVGWFLWRGPLLAMLLLVVACGEGTGDQDALPEEERASTAEDREPRVSEDDFAALAQRAEATGTVRVIVGLQVEFTAESAEEEPVNAAQREAIRREQDRIIEALEGTDYSVEHRFETVPQIVLTLSPDAVRALWRSGRAAALQIDEAVPAS